MPTIYANAIDEMFGMINATWLAGAAAIVGYTPEIFWPGSPHPAHVPMNKFWSRVSVQIVTDTQSSLANFEGKRKFHATGLIYFQLFCPRNIAGALQNGKMLAELIQDRFRKDSPSNVIWFRDQKIVELLPTDESFPINVVTIFEYDVVTGDGSVVGSPSVPLIGQKGKHYPVEAPDGIRVTFTFIGLPIDPLLYAIEWNGLVQDGLVQNGEQLTFGDAPKTDAQILGYY